VARRIRIALAVIVALSAAYAGCSWAAKKGYLGRSVREEYDRFLASPQMYANLWETPIHSGSDLHAQRFSLEPSYPGRYAVSCISNLGRQLPIAKSYAPYLSVQFTCTSQHGTPSTFMRTDVQTWWIGEESGFDLIWFRVPEDLPTDQVSDCLLTLDPGADRFHDDFGVRALFVHKLYPGM